MPDDLASTLAGIRETLHVAELGGLAEWSDGYIPSALYRFTASLLAAVEAVLEAAGEAIPGVAALHCTCAAGSPDTCTCQDATAAWTLDPAKLREIITTALAGKEQDHD